MSTEEPLGSLSQKVQGTLCRCNPCMRSLSFRASLSFLKVTLKLPPDDDRWIHWMEEAASLPRTEKAASHNYSRETARFF